MRFVLLALFIGVPLIEIAAFIQVGQIIGLGWTLVCVVLTAIAGTMLLRHQGFATLSRAQAQIQSGRPPVLEMLEGVCLLIAACLLLTPGFVTDAVGALLLIPPIRRYLAAHAVGKVMAHGDFSVRRGPARGDDNDVIDGDWEDVTVKTPDPDQKILP